MRRWDARVRIRAALVAAHALALAAACEGLPRGLAAVAGLSAALLVIRSFALDRPARETPLPDAPSRPGGLLAGLGAEWTPLDAEEMLERGLVAWPAESEWVLPDALLDRHV